MVLIGLVGISPALAQENGGKNEENEQTSDDASEDMAEEVRDGSSINSKITVQKGDQFKYSRDTGWVVDILTQHPAQKSQVISGSNSFQVDLDYVLTASKVQEETITFRIGIRDATVSHRLVTNTHKRSQNRKNKSWEMSDDADPVTFQITTNRRGRVLSDPGSDFSKALEERDCPGHLRRIVALVLWGEDKSAEFQKLPEQKLKAVQKVLENVGDNESIGEKQANYMKKYIETVRNLKEKKSTRFSLSGGPLLPASSKREGESWTSRSLVEFGTTNFVDDHEIHPLTHEYTVSDVEEGTARVEVNLSDAILIPFDSDIKQMMKTSPPSTSIFSSDSRAVLDLSTGLLKHLDLHDRYHARFFIQDSKRWVDAMISRTETVKRKAPEDSKEEEDEK